MPSSTPTAQVRIPLTGPILSPLSPPPTSAHIILIGGKKIRRRKKLCAGRISIRERQRTTGGGIIIRRRARVGQKIDEKFHSAENYRTVPKVPYSIF